MPGVVVVSFVTACLAGPDADTAEDKREDDEHQPGVWDVENHLQQKKEQQGAATGEQVERLYQLLARRVLDAVARCLRRGRITREGRRRRPRAERGGFG